MRMKKGLIAATCISSLLFGGCNVTMNADDIMSAPKLSITEENIQSIIKENLGENIKLLKPKNHNSPIRFIDIDIAYLVAVCYPSGPAIGTIIKRGLHLT